MSLGRLFRRSKFDRFAAAGASSGPGVRNARYHRDEFAIEYRSRSERNRPGCTCRTVRGVSGIQPAGRADRSIVRGRLRGTSHDAGHLGSCQSLAAAGTATRQLRKGRSVRGTVVSRRPALPYLDEMVVVDQPASMGYVTDACGAFPLRAGVRYGSGGFQAQGPVLPPLGWMCGWWCCGSSTTAIRTSFLGRRSPGWLAAPQELGAAVARRPSLLTEAPQSSRQMNQIPSRRSSTRSSRSTAGRAAAVPHGMLKRPAGQLTPVRN